MGSPRQIDERDLEYLLKHLTDRQIARLYEIPIETVQRLRFDRLRRKKESKSSEPVDERNH